MMDERFLVHRLKATRLACVAGSILLGGWFLYYYFVRGEARHDLLSVMVMMAVVKLAAMVWYRRTN